MLIHINSSIPLSLSSLNSLIPYTRLPLNSSNTPFILLSKVNPFALAINSIINLLIWIIVNLKLFKIHVVWFKISFSPSHISHDLISIGFFQTDLNLRKDFFHLCLISLLNKVLASYEIPQIFFIHDIKNRPFLRWIKLRRLKFIIWDMIVWFFHMASCESSMEHSFSFLIKRIVMLVFLLDSPIVDFIILDLKRSSNH